MLTQYCFDYLITQGIATLGPAWARVSKQYWVNMRLPGYIPPVFIYHLMNTLQFVTKWYSQFAVLDRINCQQYNLPNFILKSHVIIWMNKLYKTDLTVHVL